MKKRITTKDEQKVQFVMSVNLINNTNIDKSRTFHVRSDNVEFRMGSNTDDAVT